MRPRWIAGLTGVVLILLFSPASYAFVREEMGGVFAFWPGATTNLNPQVGCPSTCTSSAPRLEGKCEMR